MRSRYLPAVAALEKALALWDHPAIRFNLAVCFIQLDRNKEAYLHLTEALKGDKEILGEKWAEARSYYRLLRQRVARVRISCDDPGAEVSLDGRRLFTAPGAAELVIRPGRHQLLATRTGYVTVSRTLHALAGRRTAFRIKLLKGERAFCFRSFYRYHWAVPSSVSVAAAAAIATGLALVLKGRSVIDETSSDVRAAFAPVPGTTGLPISEVEDRQRQGQQYQGAGYSMLVISGALIVTSVMLWMYWKKRVDTKKSESLLRIPF
ncbi:MAG: hypothetical protein ABI333_08335 [bacterium]